MENKRSAVQKVAKLKELGIFDKWVANTDRRTRMYPEINIHSMDVACTRRRNGLLTKQSYLSDMIESSFIFVYAPEGREFWFDIVDKLRSEI